ncbi:hypothetical protein HYW99_01865 [Candidatus Woesearchaeota archaeon]|nr:hypothetical protein [Candidatus Woesearchaeota archaeon]
MNEATLTREKAEKIARIKSENLFFKLLRRFLRESAEILDLAEETLIDADAVINNDKRLQAYAHEHNLLNTIESLKKKIEDSPDNLDKAVQDIENLLRKLQEENPQLAQLVSNERIQILQEIKYLQQISTLLKEPDKAILNIDILLSYTEKLQNAYIKKRIKARLALIKKHQDEIKVLTEDEEDIKLWNYQTHFDISFYTGKVNSYFNGLEDKQGLDYFGGTVLRQQVYNSKEIKRLFYIIGFTYKADEQLIYISSLISFLQQDISGGVWIRNITTKKFVANVDDYATTFQESFGNKFFADILIRNKAILGEQPFKWIKLLTKMEEVIEGIMQRKNVVIENAKNFLIATFANRREQLNKSIAIMVAQLQTILKEFETEKDIIDLIKISIKRLKRVVNRLWKERKNKFNKAKREINVAALREKIVSLTQRTDIIKESNDMIVRIKAFRDFQIYMKNITSKGTISEDDLTPLFLTDYGFAKMKQLAEEVFALEDKIKGKNILLQYESVQLKEDLRNFLSKFTLLLQWLVAIRLMVPVVEINTIRSRLEKFRGDYYGAA